MITFPNDDMALTDNRYVTTIKSVEVFDKFAKEQYYWFERIIRRIFGLAVPLLYLYDLLFAVENPIFKKGDEISIKGHHLTVIYTDDYGRTVRCYSAEWSLVNMEKENIIGENVAKIYTV